MAVYILTRRIAEYRVGVFEKIALKIPDLIVLTEKPPARPVSFSWRLVSRYKFLGFSFLDIPRIGRDDVLVSGLELSNLSIWHLLLWRNKRFIIWGHGFGRHRFSFLVRWIRILAAKRAAASLFYTEGGRQSFCPFVSEKRLYVAVNTICLPTHSWPIEDNRDSFLYFGDLRREKGIEMLISAFERVAYDFAPFVRLVIVGDGSLKEHLVQRARISPCAERIFFYPRTLSPEDLNLHLDRAIATVSPLHVGLSVVQSFWAGVPIITQRNAGHAPEFEYCLNGENSVIFDGGTEALVDAMMMLLNKQTQRKFAEAARHYFEEYLKIEDMIDGFVCSVNHVQPDD